MITVSKEMKAYLSRTGRSLNAKIKVGETEISEGIMSVLVDSTMCADSLSFGCVNTSYAEISLFNCPENISGCEIEAYIIAEVNGADEEALIGTFKVEKPKTEEGLTTFTAYDKTKYNTSGVYITAFESAEVSIDDVFNEVCGQCNAEGVPLFLSETPDTNKPKINPKLLDGYVLKDVLGQIAGFMGGNLVCNNEGKFEVRRFTDCRITLDGDMCESPTVSEDVFILNSLTCINGETILTSGEGNGISFENILMTQEQLDAILVQYKGLTYRDTDVTNLVGNPCLQAGDIVTLEIGENAYKVPIMHITVDYDGGIMNEIQAYYKTDDESSGGHVSLSKKVTQNENSIKLQEELRKTFNETLKTGLQQGLYHKTITNAEGADITYYFNKPEIEDATYIYYFGAAGQVWTSGTDCWNGGNPVWKFGTTSDGDAILENLLLRTLTADLIRAGTLHSLNGSTFFNLDKGEIGSETTEEAVYIFGSKTSLGINYTEKTLKKTSKLTFEAGSLVQSVLLETVSAEGEESEVIDSYTLSLGLFADVQKGMTFSHLSTYFNKTGKFYFKKPDDWDSKSEIAKAALLIAYYAAAKTMSDGITLNDSDSGTVSNLSSKGWLLRKITDYENSPYFITQADKNGVVSYTADAEGNATEQEAGFMAFDKGDGTRLYGNISDVYAFRNGASARPVFYKSLGYVDIENEPSIDLREYLPEEQKSFCGKLTLCHTMGCSEYQIYFGEYNTDDWRAWIDTKYVTQTSSYAGGAYRGNVPVIKGLKTVGQHSCLTDYALTISTVNDTSVVTRNGASYMYLEILG